MHRRRSLLPVALMIAVAAALLTAIGPVNPSRQADRFPRANIASEAAPAAGALAAGATGEARGMAVPP
jgi:hypothetical protein